MAGELILRDAVPGDAEALSAIYAHYVLHTVITFDETPLTSVEWAGKVAHMQADGWPVLVAEVDGEVLGYAYVSQFRPKSAYRFTVEDSIYLAPTATGRGIGRPLLTELLERSRAAGARSVIAVIAAPGEVSVALHARAGFLDAGVLRDVGFKFGGWVDTIQMQLML
ncbi:MAG: family N-acetyltransferase [Pseudonocardiales bacterium]|nr:family N-acetyltransferase [Jatrophihabitantaceae bacterium]MCW2605299.1 family N-acetyltransferase [Pseudonocardiales bacterium]